MRFIAPPGWPPPPAADWLPRRLKVLATCLFALAGVAEALAIPHLGGQPERINGNFFTHNHGSFTPVSYDAYLTGLAGDQAFFCAGALIFLTIELCGAFVGR